MNMKFKHGHIYKITYHKNEWFIGLAWSKKNDEYINFFVLASPIENVQFLTVKDLPLDIDLEKTKHLTVKDLPLYIDLEKTRLYNLLLKYKNPKKALLQLAKERKVTFDTDEFIQEAS